jgi:hypothetical protein
LVKIEADGDLHLDLQDATGDKAAIVVCEVPAKPQLVPASPNCVGWTHVQFRFRVRSGRKLKLTQPLIIRISGRRPLFLM